MTYSINNNAKLEVKDVGLVVTRAFKINGKNYDVTIAGSQFEKGNAANWESTANAVKIAVQAYFKQVAKEMGETHFGAIKIVYEKGSQTSTVTSGNGSPKEGKDILIDGDEFAFDAQISEKYATLDAATQFLCNKALKPHFVEASFLVDQFPAVSVPTSPLENTSRPQPVYWQHPGPNNLNNSWSPLAPSSARTMNPTNGWNQQRETPPLSLSHPSSPIIVLPQRVTPFPQTQSMATPMSQEAESKSNSPHQSRRRKRPPPLHLPFSHVTGLQRHVSPIQPPSPLKIEVLSPTPPATPFIPAVSSSALASVTTAESVPRQVSLEEAWLQLHAKMDTLMEFFSFLQ